MKENEWGRDLELEGGIRIFIPRDFIEEQVNKLMKEKGVKTYKELVEINKK